MIVRCLHGDRASYPGSWLSASQMPHLGEGESQLQLSGSSQGNVAKLSESRGGECQLPVRSHPW
jgi:hypothetical protein